MSRRNGISFTLTVVVAGVILIMTALSVITLGGSSISSFFSTLGGQQQEQVRQADIQQACQDRVREINRQYCDQYITPADGGDQTSGDGEPPGGGGAPGGSGCSSTHPRRQTADDVTATEQGCDWRANTNLNWEVTVGGSTYNCAERGLVVDTTVCPAEMQ